MDTTSPPSSVPVFSRESPSLVTARLVSLASAGEVLISEAAYTASGSDVGDFERGELSVKGRSAPLAVRVLRA